MFKVLAIIGIGLATGLPGCYSTPCWQSYTCPEPVRGEELSCDPAAAGIRDECPGVFVSSGIGDDGNEGTRDEPVRTLGAAITAAQSGTRRIYACAEAFAEAVSLPMGIEIWGGLDCAETWGYIGDSTKTTIRPEAGLLPLRVMAGSGRAVMADVRAEAAHATQPSASSIAVIVGANAAFDILRSELIAGDGARGLDGTPGGTVPAQAGDAGAPGAAACSASTVQGGGGATNSCRGYDSIGGTGGLGAASEGGDGSNGTIEPYPNPSGAGHGGVGATSAGVCADGMNGADGAQGAHGLGAVHTWGVSDLGWAGPAGQDGADGLPGQGGGGGGGSRAGAAFCGAALGGASGGGGGAGGCGGAGGKGGGAGGASIGVLALSDEVTIRSTSIRTGRGGDGGSGGLGQIGGIRGGSGAGGVGVNPALEGCDGGLGGDGGNGGNGGGGLGGPSIGILFPFGTTPLHDADIRTGEAGKGGLGGDPNVPGSAGQDGVRADTLGVPPQ